MAINLLIVDDDKLIRDSLCMYAKYDKNLNVIGVCSNGDEAFSICMSEKIDVVLMDIRMPVCDGVLGTKKIKQAFPEIKILILTTFDDDEYIFEALKNGANGYLLKNTSPGKIMEDVKIVYEGNMLIHPDIASKMTRFLGKDSSSNCGNELSGHGLSDIEKDIVSHISEGHTNKEISEMVHLSEGTIKNYITDILSKLNLRDSNLRDRTQIAIFYYKSKR